MQRLLVGALVATLLGASCRAPLPADQRDWRSSRERAVRGALPAGAAFAGLRFYPFSPAYRVRTMLEPVVPPEPLRLATSDGHVRPATRVATVRVAVPTGSAVLNLYRLEDIGMPDHLFLPFRDAGAGEETYGAGRYVEVERLPGGVVEVDFNRAYNPDCAYGITAQCPVTPAENTLPFAVRAGEMTPPGHD